MRRVGRDRHRRRETFAAVVALALFAIAPSSASADDAGAAQDVGDCLGVTVAATIAGPDDGIGLRLSGEETGLRLAGIEIVDPVSARALVDGLAGRAIRYRTVGEPKPDRRRRLPALVVLDGEAERMADGAPAGRRHLMQADILARGLGLLSGEDLPCGAILEAAEARGRAAGAGVWGPGGMPIDAADPALGGHVSDYVVVAGRVLSVGGGGARYYLNFGHDWATDLTITMRRDLAVRLLKSPVDDADRLVDQLDELLADHVVEARGFLRESGGPAIDLSDERALRVK